MLLLKRLQLPETNGLWHGGFLTTVYKPWWSEDRACVLLQCGVRMLRRKPTRLELNLDDTEEFDSVKKELESRKKQRDEVDVVGVATSGEMGGATGGSNEGKTREQMINERIGYKPHPKPNTLPSLFGNLQF
ncbi:hypothetical protein COCON_G00163420 [Conger conger]|uniref:Anaphase-promoting complex subunit CDC26 n=2 Tax=Conger conger TaxID=82655 RepID=A0A9Q1D756_CONCO|nr:hypothetical protein COCON_G00163420 [Conger conger]